MLLRMDTGLIIPSAAELTVTVIRTVVIFLFTFLLLRIIGKRQVSQFTWFDILLIVALGSAVGDVMIYPEHTVAIVTSMAAIFIVVILVRVLTYMVLKSPAVEAVIEGKEEILVHNGRIMPEALRKADLTERELRTLLRERGFPSLRGIDEVILEINDDISIIKKQPRKKPTATRKINGEKL